MDEIGVEFEEPEADKLDSIIERFGTTFPKTAEFSHLARLTLPEVRAEDDPDAALIAWLDHEEALFRRLERKVVSSRIEAGFVDDSGTDVDGFISFSLSVQNRRKSRMGHSLENHLAAVLGAHDIRHVRGAVTEHNHKPDFLFPDLETYPGRTGRRRPPPDDAGGQIHLQGSLATGSGGSREDQPQAPADTGTGDFRSRRQTRWRRPAFSSSSLPRFMAAIRLLQRGWLWSVDDFIGEVRARQT